MLAGFPIRKIQSCSYIQNLTVKSHVLAHWCLFTQACCLSWKGGYSGSTRCTWTWRLLTESPNVLCYSAGLGARPLLTWIYISSCLPYPHTFRSPAHCFFENYVTSCSLTTSVQRNKINCWCTWRGANRLRANRRDQMFVSKHTTLRLGLFLLLCPDSFFILFKQLDGKENWLKPNWCFMVSSSAQKMAV